MAEISSSQGLLIRNLFQPRTVNPSGRLKERQLVGLSCAQTGVEILDSTQATNAGPITVLPSWSASNNRI
jgi:hypothetical protein